MTYVLLGMMLVTSLCVLVNIIAWLWNRTQANFWAGAFNAGVTYITYLTIVSDPVHMAEAAQIIERIMNVWSN